MKNKLFKNLGLKFLAVIFAIILWLVVMNVSDYAVTNKVKDIPVIQLNGDALSELDQVYDVTKGNTVDIIVKGRRSLVDGLTSEDFIATADLSTMSITNTVQIFVEPKNKNLKDEITITYVDNTMSLSLEDKVSAQLPVSIKVFGTPMENYAVGTTSTTPNIITIEGPKTAVTKVTRAEVEINVDNRSEGFTSDSKIILYDAYDEEINNDKLILSNDEVNVKAEIFPIKSIPVKVNIKGSPSEGYLVNEVLFQPQTVMIAGKPEELAQINSVTIDDLSVKGLSSNFETTVDVSDYLPEGIVLAKNNQDMVVTVSIEKAERKVLKPTDSDFTLYNKDEGLLYDVTTSNDFSIIVTGLKKDLVAVDRTSVRLKIDCSEFYYGLYMDVPFDMNKSDSLSYEIEGKVDVEVSKEDEAVDE